MAFLENLVNIITLTAVNSFRLYFKELRLPLYFNKLRFLKTFDQAVISHHLGSHKENLVNIITSTAVNSFQLYFKELLDFDYSSRHSDSSRPSTKLIPPENQLTPSHQLPLGTQELA
ncbi:hypothetical protein PGTUg99_024595 [Puccinia graminis f. sp. tritici]|uniref:Uncharacterized protein n=1 Tax=Puccinia graminis f. sp. tritici TaxID=56615 RepID=A0A5B0SIT7_PUCGR|nr:hypothetical protein PGTUg99_024595 [Puccinia graminis f. sp. tritici]